MILTQGRALTFVVYGLPVPQAALRTGKTGKSYYPNGKELRPWRKAIARAAAEAAAGLPAWPLAKHAAAELDVTYWLPRPPSVSRSRRPLPSVRPDKQHLDRAVEDGLTDSKAIWVDDAQVTDGGSRKRYCEPGGRPCAVITIRPLSEV